VSQAPGRAIGPLYEKGAGPGTRVQSVTVAGRPGFWLDGAPHRFQYVGPDGGGLHGEARLAANVLLWEQGGLILRLESALPLDAALRIASSMC